MKKLSTCPTCGSVIDHKGGSRHITEFIDRETLENVFVTALEGGSNYWYYIGDDAVSKIREVVPRDADSCLSTAMFKAVYDHNVSVDIRDVEDQSEVLGTISMDTMLDRLTSLSRDSVYCHHLEAEVHECGDAESSDVVFQYIVLGEVVYG
jgi:hypothetical protein